MKRFVVMITVTMLVVGCKKDPPAGSTSGSAATTSGSGSSAVGVAPVSPSAGSAAGNGSGAPATAASTGDPVKDAKPAPKDLPAFGGKASTAAKQEATELANLALGAQAGMNDEDPLAKAVAAVKADPGSALARYAVACVAGDEAFDVAQLTPLTTATGCADCVDLVRNLAMTDWHECGWSAGVKALSDKVKPSAQRMAAEAVLRSLGDGDPKHAEAFFKAPSVELFVSCSVCDESDKGKLTKAAGAKQLGALVGQVKKAKAEDGIGGIVIYGGLQCAADCCAVDVGQLQHNHDFFEKVCFKPGSDQVRRIDIIGGG